MPLEISVGPPRLTINQGHTVLVTEQDGQIGWPTDKGLYDLDTRLIPAGGFLPMESRGIC